MYCKGEGPYCNFYFSNNKTLLISKTLKEAEVALQGGDFCRIHNSYLVNIIYIQKYIRGEGGEVILANGVSLPVSRTRKQDFMFWLERL
jgi:two-component system LytT family response regulator